MNEHNKDPNPNDPAPAQDQKRSDTEIAILSQRSESVQASARRWEQVVRNVMVWGGTIAAIYIPLSVAWPLLTAPDPVSKTHRHDQYALVHDHPYAPAHEHPYAPAHEHPYAPIHEHSGTRDGDIYILPSAVRMNAAGAVPTWHRSAFVNTNDEFWAVPDANFKLTLVGSDEPCTADRCLATFHAHFLTSDLEQTIVLTGRNFLTTNLAQSGVCQRRNAGLPQLVCDLPAENVCLWLRRAETLEAPNERVALDIRWEKSRCQ